MIDVEVALNPLFAGGPLLGDVDALLRARGFLLWRLPTIVHHHPPGARRAIYASTAATTTATTARAAVPTGMLSWADAHYVREDLAGHDDARDWVTALRDAVLANALAHHDLTSIALRRALEAGAPPEVAAGDPRGRRMTRCESCSALALERGGARRPASATGVGSAHASHPVDAARPLSRTPERQLAATNQRLADDRQRRAETVWGSRRVWTASRRPRGACRCESRSTPPRRPPCSTRGSAGSRPPSAASSTVSTSAWTSPITGSRACSSSPSRPPRTPDARWRPGARPPAQPRHRARARRPRGA